MKIIPAIDIIDGKCVRLTQGDYSKQKTYNNDPLEVAREFEDHGIQYLHLVDLDGAKAKHIVNYPVLEKIAGKTNLKIDFGGGIKSNNDARIAFECGARQITGGSIAVTNKAIFTGWIQQYGQDKVILGADVKNEKIAINGWKEDSDQDLFPFIKSYLDEGVNYCICTDIAKDGMLEGPAIDLYKKIMEQFPSLNLVASGGVSSMQDLFDLAETNIYGVIIGKAIYEGKISLKDLIQFT